MFGKKGKTTFKTREYQEYQENIRDYLLGEEWPFSDSLVQFTIDAGLSNRGADIDNVIKPLLDTYQGMFEEFNDNKVYQIEITKNIVKKGEEYLTVTVEEYHASTDNTAEDDPDSGLPASD
jgi:Holliday junction resolvase RusA-like endonuclease